MKIVSHVTYFSLRCPFFFIWKMGAILGPVSVVKQDKYDDCVKTLNTAPVGVGGQMWVGSTGFTPLLSYLGGGSALLVLCLCWVRVLYTFVCCYCCAVVDLLFASDFSVWS